MVIEWDEEKNQKNIAKHGISFNKAREVFEDPFHLSIPDKRFNYYEERWITMGQTGSSILIVVAHTCMDANGNELTRIISARHATGKERRQYEDHGI
ncbi:MAG: BrnT family toxin [Candidatus Eremiobacteraeota bacterium]|nr:BrnT family toxin [Candidatus Eremiobacteraeota bacterium]